MNKIITPLKLLVIGIALLSSTFLQGQVSNIIADSVYNGWLKAYLIKQSATQTFFANSLTDHGRAFFWGQAYDITTVEDAYDGYPTAARKQLILDLLNTLLVNETTNWSWDTWNDDVEWALIASIRGYKITGNKAFLDAATNNWKMIWTRGWGPRFGGGIWELMDDSNSGGGKGGLANWPFIIAGCMIYEETKDIDILNKCKQDYTWTRANCYDPKTGRVYEGTGKDGMNGDDNSYNSGLLVNAAGSLYKITKDTLYYNDAITAASHYIGRIGGLSKGIMTEDHPSNGSFGSDQFARGLAKLARENFLWTKYYQFFTNNCNAAWSHRRTDYNFTWNNFSKNTITDNSLWCMEVQSSVTMQMVTPVVQSIPGIIEAEKYNYMEGITVGNITAGGKNISSNNSGDWLEYLINVPATGVYTISYKVASLSTDTLILKQNNITLDTIIFTGTGDLQTYKTVNSAVKLNSGIQSIKLVAVSKGCNIDSWTATNCQSIVSSVSINGAPELPMDTIKVNIDDVILFNPQPADGVWSWTGPNNFKNPGRQLTINNIQLQQGGVYTAKYISPDGCISVHDFMISLNSCTPTDITTDIAVNGIFLNSSDAVSVNVGSYLLIAPKQNDGLWKWTGPDGFTSTSNKISFLGIDVKQAGKYSATYYNANGCRSTKDISVTVNGSELCSTPIIPYVQVNGGNWLSVNYATVTSGGSFTFGPQPNDGGSWTWTGPGSFTSTSRQNTISEFNDTKAGIYSAIYTNSIGCISVLDFIVGKNNCTPVSITPTIKVNSVLSSRTDSIIVNSGSNISIELPVSSNDGILSWTGPNGLKADSSKMNLNNILNWSEGKFVATFISKDGCQSSQTINISVTGDDYCGTPIIPFIQVGTGKSINTDTATVSVGGKITFGPHPIIENSWNWYWTCPQITSNTNKRVLVIDAFSAVKSGIYKAIYVNAAGCMSFRNFNIKLKTATDIVNINENDKISFFPNPVVDVLTITNISFNTNINITNLAGQTMLSAKSTNMNHEVIMDVSKLKPGIYLINVENDSKQSFKFLKN